MDSKSYEKRIKKNPEKRSHSERTTYWRNIRKHVFAISQSVDEDEWVEEHTSTNETYSLKNSQLFPEHRSESESSHDLFSENNSAKFNDNNCLSETINFPLSNDTNDYDTSNECQFSTFTDASYDHLLSEHIRIWALQHRCTQACVNGLLNILRSHGHQLPKDSRSILGTLDKVQTTELNAGEYYYLGIRKGLEDILKNNIYADKEIKLLFNVDGLPIFKSSGYQLWLITSQFSNFNPFTIALYGGYDKPTAINFLHDFSKELQEFHNKTVILCGKFYIVSIFAIPCDSPARSLLKGTVQHSGYNACERCDDYGVPVQGRIVYDTTNPNLISSRTDNGLRTGQYSERNNDNRCHHHNITPLYEIHSLDLVKQFPLDYMHLVCLGAVRRILYYFKGSYPRIYSGRLSAANLIKISNRLSQIKGKLPSEFVRQPRELTEVNRWKATELRTFLLYTGIVVLKNVLNPKTYKHFLSLVLAIRMLCEENINLRQTYLNSARELINYFVTNAHEHYGNTFTVYCIHNLKHLPDDVEYFQLPLDAYSCFRFENYLQTIKRLVRGKKNPLKEIIKRLDELKGTLQENSTHITKLDCAKNSWFLSKNYVCFIKEILPNGRLVYNAFKKTELDNFFIDFIDSNKLNIFVIKKDKHPLEKIDDVDIVLRKCVCLMHEDDRVIIPLLNSANFK
nr:uncharacterized protein LOC124805780 isoform X1 [Hydra vulgaris]